MRTRTLVAGLAIWAGVVAAGSGTTWLVIDRAGRDVVAGRAPTPRAPAAVAPADSGTPTPHPSASAKPRSHHGTRGPAAAASSATGSPGRVFGSATPDLGTPDVGTTPRGRDHDGGADSTSPRPQSQPPTPPRTVTRTWSGSSGRITVSCRGERATLVSASPADGWRVEVGNRGPQQVEVELKQGEEGAEMHVTSTCVGGAPRFRVQRGD